ncbi:MAG: DUF2127 domain-containing protein [Patescibacteria group bacterium]|nr:DUF2127 domain-containing protein [Patescibacteria group bacterium]MDE2116569.1 DUF2127 domain-containing protein [Patescibacteria group bacterium]
MQEKTIRRIFVISLIIKAIDAAVETLAGVALLFTGSLTGAIMWLVRGELIEDPTDFLATHISNLASHITAGDQIYGALYLLSHGIVKMFLVWGLIKNRLWAYPASLVVFALFIVYQMITYLQAHSVFMLVLTVFDIFLMVLVWHEYRYLLRVRHESAD